MKRLSRLFKHKVILAGAVVTFGLCGIFLGVANAQSFRTGDNTTVGSDEVVDSTLFTAGRTINIAGEVNGDVFCAGQTVTVSGTVHGDVLCAAQTIVISGTVHGDVRAAAQTITLSGMVHDNLTAASQSFIQDAKSQVGGDASIAGDDVIMGGEVGRDAALTGSRVTLTGAVGRNVQAATEDLRLENGASVGGNVDYASEHDAFIASNATIGGEVTKSVPEKQTGTQLGSWIGVGLWFALYMLIAFLVAALVLVLLFPQAIHAVSGQAVRSPGKTLLTGLVATIATPVLIVLLMITIVGIPLGLLLLGAWVLLLAFAGIMSAYYLARLLWKRQQNPVVLMLIGVPLLLVLYLVPIVGFFVCLAAIFMGSGMTLLELKKRWPKPSYKLK